MNIEAAVFFIIVTNTASLLYSHTMFRSDILGILYCFPPLVICFNNESSFMSKMLKWAHVMIKLL
jgi:hypothetical protein